MGLILGEVRDMSWMFYDLQRTEGSGYKKASKNK